MRKLLLLISVLTVCVIGCTTSYDAPEIPSQETKSKKYISENEAYEIALKCYKEFGFLSDSRRTKYASVRLYDNLPQSRNSSSDQDTSFYIVNFLDGGFVVVAAQRDVINPIYGIAENGSFDAEDNPNLQYYMELGREHYGSNASTNGWLNPIIPPIQKADTVYFYPVDSTITYVNRYVPTKWGQWYPYNYYCPFQISASGNCPVGCVPLAMAQIMAFHRYPSSYTNEGQSFELNWDYILLCNNLEELEYSNGTGLDQAQRLLRELGKMAHAIYKDNVTTAYSRDAVNALHSLGYSASHVISSPTIGQCFNSLRNYGPFFIEGLDYLPEDKGGHAWVADAGKTVKIFIDRSANGKGKTHLETSYYLNMNWGSRGKGDGFYKIPTTFNSANSPDPQIVYDSIRVIIDINPAP